MPKIRYYVSYTIDYPYFGLHDFEAVSANSRREAAQMVVELLRNRLAKIGDKPKEIDVYIRALVFRVREMGEVDADGKIYTYPDLYH